MEHSTNSLGGGRDIFRIISFHFRVLFYFPNTYFEIKWPKWTFSRGNFFYLKLQKHNERWTADGAARSARSVANILGFYFQLRPDNLQYSTMRAANEHEKWLGKVG